MQLSSLHLVNFKNYLSEKVEFSARLNCIVGLNGMGKTNLLDAIYYLCMCKSRTGGSDRNVVNKSDGKRAEFFRLEGVFQHDGAREAIVAKVKPGSLKEFEKNKSTYERLYDHIGLFPVVFIMPDDSDLLLEGSESRRLLMDNVLSQMHREYLLNLVAYNRILKQRNAALKKFAEEGGYDPALLKVYNEQLLEPARLIYKHRQHFTEVFNPLVKEIYGKVSGDREEISCRYKSDLHEDSLSSLLGKNMERDRVLGRTTVGIHKDDLIFTLNDFPLKRFASQGQLKSFVLAVKLSQYHILRKEKNEPPLLLLDDIFDKLDDHRIGNLLQMLSEETYGQIFLTDAHEQRIEEIIRRFSIDYKKFIVEDGKII